MHTKGLANYKHLVSHKTSVCCCLLDDHHQHPTILTANTRAVLQKSPFWGWAYIIKQSPGPVGFAVKLNNLEK